MDAIMRYMMPLQRYLSNDLMAQVKWLMYITLTTPYSHAHLGYKHQYQDDGGSQKEPCTHNCRKCIDIVCQSVCGDDDHSQDNTGDVDGSRNVLGVVQTLHLHLACAEGKDEGSDLQQSLVAIQHSKQSLSAMRLADMHKKQVDFCCFLY